MGVTSGCGYQESLSATGKGLTIILERASNLSLLNNTHYLYITRVPASGTSGVRYLE